MHKLRLRYSKTGTAKYISHLDLTSTMARALRRTGVRLKYSEGFNPHPYLSVALPLPVGCGSICELMDFGTEYELLPDGLPELISAGLPEGLGALDVYIPERKFSEIKWIKLNGLLYYDKGVPEDAAAALAERFSEGSIVISKTTKRGISRLDIAPYIKDVAFSGHDVINFTVQVSAQNPSVGPGDLINSLDGEYGRLKPGFFSFTRIETYDADSAAFR